MPVCVCEALSTPERRAIVPSGLMTAHRLEPDAPAGPVGPRAPAEPGGPGGPTDPLGPAGSWPGAKSTLSSEEFLTLDDVTAFAWSCAFPTLFRGRRTAAWPVP